MKWTDISKEKPQEGVMHFFRATANEQEQKLVAYFCKYRTKEWLAIPFAGEEIGIDEFTSCYWLKEEIDWESLEKKFNEDFSTLTDKPMVGYDVIQWFREKLD
jgi:hypothetical protein